MVGCSPNQFTDQKVILMYIYFKEVGLKNIHNIEQEHSSISKLYTILKVVNVYTQAAYTKLKKSKNKNAKSTNI